MYNDFRQMRKSRETGSIGEQLAVDYLLNKSFEILERNWRFSHAEIDIIAKKDGCLIFIEVKTRENIEFGKPEEFLTTTQEKRIKDAASEYMKTIDHDWEIRFDIISIILPKNGSHSIEHFEDAFH